jgi:hypothetical protein
MEYIYVFRCAGETFYVGSTPNVGKEFVKHRLGNGVEWTRRHLPKEVVLQKPRDSIFEITELTKKYMMDYGIHRVRGGIYSDVQLTEEAVHSLIKEFHQKANKCFKCGIIGHFLQDCPLSEEELEEEIDEEYWSDSSGPRRGVCHRCGRYGHYEDHCYAKVHNDGHELQQRNLNIT